MNTKNLKSSKLLKLMKESGLIAGQSDLPKEFKGRAKQISSVEMDLLFKHVCAAQGSDHKKISE